MLERFILLLLMLMPALMPGGAAAAAGYPLLDGFGSYSSAVGGTGIRAVAVQPWDGKILIGGDFSITGGEPALTRHHLARLNHDGTIDSSFTPDLDGGPVNAIAIQPDPGSPGQNLILVGGAFTSITSAGSGMTVKGLARLRSDGTLDLEFHPVSSTKQVTVNALLLHPDGRSVLVGGKFEELVNEIPSPNFARISVATPDPGASQWRYRGEINGEVYALLQQGGNVLVGGSFSLPAAGLARFKGDGSLDGSFSIPAPGGAVRSMALQADGRIVIGGEFSGGALGRNYLARLEKNPQGSWLPDGFNPSPGGAVTSLWVEPDGKIVAGGRFSSIGAPAATRHGLAWLSMEGAPATAFDPGLDGAVWAIARQPDGKILAGGDFAKAGPKSRARLARFYPHGALDDDLPALSISGDVIALSQHPDGNITLGGIFTQVQNKPRSRIARIGEDWKLVDAATFNANLVLYASSGAFAPLPYNQRDDLIVGGNFAAVNFSGGVQVQKLVVRVDPAGNNVLPFNSNIGNSMSTGLNNSEWMRPNVIAVAPPEAAPDGTPLDPMIYIGGLMKPQPPPLQPYIYLAKFNGRTGLRDESFTPPPQGETGEVYAISFLKDRTRGTFDRLLVGGDDFGAYKGRMLRLKTDGTVDLNISPLLVSPSSTVPLLNDAVYSLTVQPDGQIVATGRTRRTDMNLGQYSCSDGGFDRNLIRFRIDESDHVVVDEGFHIETSYSDTTFCSVVDRLALQADGSMIIYGVFDRIKVLQDGTERIYQVDGVARVKANGELDEAFDLGRALDHVAGNPDNRVRCVHLQPDGKIIFGGGFPGVKGDATRKFLARFSNAPAYQDLSISSGPGGYKVTWLRGGSLPELWRAYFEHSLDGVSWTPLGEGRRIEGGWELDSQDLAQYGLGENHYLRARGFESGGMGGSGAIMESVRLYYLPPAPPPTTVITVSADPQQKRYGDADPALTYSFDPPLADGDGFSGSLQRATGDNVGEYAIDQGTLALGGNYTLVYHGAPLTITKRPLVVRAENKSRLCGAANPELTASFEGLASWDSEASLGGVPRLSTGADASSPRGEYPIVAERGTISNGNYSYTFVDGVLTVTGRFPQQITFPAPRAKTFGDGDFNPGARASSGLEVRYSSSHPEYAGVVEGGRVRVRAPGTTEITAAQDGDESYEPAQDTARTLVVNPPPWNGLGFDGADDLVRLPDAPQLDFGAKEGFSIEMWLHLEGSQPEGTGLLAKGGEGSSWSGYQLILRQDRIAAEIADGAAGLSSTLTGTSSLNDGQWHHVALSVDRLAATAALYLDGRLEAQLTDQGIRLANPDNGEGVRVGVERSGLLFFKGEIDEVRLWDSARKSEEIRGALSQIIEPLEEPHLVAYFHLDEGDVGLDNARFALAPERTAHAADGSLQGFALSGPGSNWIRSGAFLPLLETTPVSGIAGDAAAGGGVVYPNYYPATDRGLCWGTNPNPGFADRCSHSGSGAGSFSDAITGLAPGTSYHVRGFASNQMGTAWGNEVTFQTARLTQSISLTLSDRVYGDPDFAIDGRATSGLPVSYASSDPTVAVIENGELRIIGAGSSIITASQSGNESYAPAREQSVLFTVRKATLNVSADDQARGYRTPNPTLTTSYRGFVKGEDGSVVTGSPLLSTAAELDSPVGSYPILTALGSLAAANYDFALQNGTLRVLRSCQEIVFPPLGERTYGDPPFEVAAFACSGLGLSFLSSNPQVARVEGSRVTITGAGSAVITASQQGSGDLEQAPEVSQPVTVHKSGQWINFYCPERKLLGDPPFTLAATSSSGLPVSYLSSDPEVAEISGSEVTLVGAGTTVVTALQEGNANYRAALPASLPLTVSLESVPPLLSLSTLSPGAVTADPVLNVTGTAGDPSGIAGLTVNGSDLTGEAALFSGAVALKAGDNSVVVSAKDGAGNVTTQTLDIVHDPAGPALEIVEPPDNSVTDSSLCTIRGTAPPGSAVALTLNGGAPQSLAVTETGFTGSGYLREGINTVEVSASLSGRVSAAKRSVTLSPGKPFVAITEPAEDVRTERDYLIIRGRAGVSGGEASVQVDAAGSVFTPPLEEGAFLQRVPLEHAGEFRIRASARDSSGNRSVAQRNIIKGGTIKGDLDGDGRVDIGDAVALLRVSLGIDPVTGAALSHGDVAPLVNGAPQPDGRIDVGDVLVLLRKIVGLADF